MLLCAVEILSVGARNLLSQIMPSTEVLITSGQLETWSRSAQHIPLYAANGHWFFSLEAKSRLFNNRIAAPVRLNKC